MRGAARVRLSPDGVEIALRRGTTPVGFESDLVHNRFEETVERFGRSPGAVLVSDQLIHRCRRIVVDGGEPRCEIPKNPSDEGAACVVDFELNGRHPRIVSRPDADRRFGVMRQSVHHLAQEFEPFASRLVVRRRIDQAGKAASSRQYSIRLTA